MTERRRPGRPRIHPSDRPSAAVHVKLSAADYDAADRLARSQRVTIQDVIRQGLRRELRDAAGH